MVDRLTELQEVRGVYILTLRGDQDTDSANTLRMIFDELAGMEDPHLVIDMTETAAIATKVYNELVRYSREMFKRSKKLRVVGLPSKTRRMLNALNARENFLFSNELTGSLLSLPKDVRGRLDVHDRREGVKRRWQGDSLGGRNRRRTERRMGLSADIVLMEV